MREPVMIGTGAGRARGLVYGAVLALAAASCADSAASEASARAAAEAIGPPRTVVAVVDFSGSQTSHSVVEARAYLEKVVKGLSYGDRLVLLEMYRSGSRDSVGSFVQDMPEPVRPGAVTSYDRRQLEAARRGVLNALPIFFDPNLVRRVPTTDLLTTMHIAAEHLHDAGEREKELLILSDMLQSTPRFEFEGARRMPPEGWVASQGRQSLLPSLRGTCVLVIGPDHTTPEGQRVRRFWGEYYQAAGATLDTGNYRLRAPTDVVDC
ncbi:MAG: hypothetical protein KY466_06710 [Gemmatimonadetes bacterium]|nr:hypothetical protein [Gemmatimonadota bacterium]